jgi:predicted component of type VI protein secretion system
MNHSVRPNETRVLGSPRTTPSPSLVDAAWFEKLSVKMYRVTHSTINPKAAGRANAITVRITFNSIPYLYP